MDGALRDLYEDVLGSTDGIALAAVGGYGRGELSPHSDVDLLFIVAPKTAVSPATLRGLLYPLWDAGFQVGHATRTARETIDRARHDLHTATTVLGARLIAGEEETFAELLDRRARWIERDRKNIVRRVLAAAAERHKRVDRAGWTLAPDIKDDAGGLRDIHTLEWIATAVGDSGAAADVRRRGELLMAVREALHALVSRPLDRIRIDLQPMVAERLGLAGDDGADVLMAAVHSTARAIERDASDGVQALAERVLGGPRRSGSVRRIGDGVRVEDGRLTLDDGMGPGGRVSPAAAMKLLAAKATTGSPLAPRTVERLRAAFDRPTVDEWDADMCAAFLDLLAGPSVVDALEVLDHVGGWGVLLPEWMGVRGRAQHDPYHRFTVDGHSYLAVATIAEAITTDPLARVCAQEAGSLDELRLGALLHDVGKGVAEDHSVAGARLARSACARMGLAAESIDEVVNLVRWHLLLVDTATRRDLDDGSVISAVAETVGNARMLRLLYILSMADGRATGPGGWSEWKGALIRELFKKVIVALETGKLPARSDASMRADEVERFDPALAGRAEAVLETLPPMYLEATPVHDMADELRLLLNPPGPGEIRYRIDDAPEGDLAAVTVCVTDRPGTLARTAGVLALHRMSVLRAQVYSTSTSLALERFVVTPPPQPRWDELTRDLEAAYSGRLALDAALGRKIADYHRAAIAAEVRVLDDASSHATVVEVRAPDALGLLYAIASALSDLDLDIEMAKIDTLGERVVDVFYVRTLWGSKLDDVQRGEVERAVRHRVGRLFG